MNYEISITPRSEREELISQRVDASKEFDIQEYDLRGSECKLPKISLPIETRLSDGKLSNIQRSTNRNCK